MSDYREQLKQIRTFPSLVKFLRDELDWPVETDDFEELTFDYEPEELGIDKASAAKIDEIKRLRPLLPDQPWGIFFVKFEPKQLPVVALRRILAGVVVKKRATASAAEQPKWAEDDLLFISNYGDGYERKISFAHFSRGPAKRDLPTLKVIAWDELDTPLHLDHTADLLVERLSWPASADERDDEKWRERWSSAFELRHREVITTAKVLAERLAELARRIRAEILRVIEIETEDGKVTRLMKSFKETLVEDLDADGFADMYAQTIAYGLLSARIADPDASTVDDFVAHMRTSPFLRELMEAFLHVGGRRGKTGGAGIDFDELGVSAVVALLDDPNTNMDAIVRDFGDRNRQEDPVIHFYESFLSAYDRKLKIKRGVFYTPAPVVSYIVRSVHELLQSEFGLADGLADTTTWGEMVKKHPSLKLPALTDEPGERRTISPDEPFVQILDPATGTATFLVEVIDVIHDTLSANWKRQGLTDAQQRAAWNDYVPQHLLPRLHAYELMMAPYAIAHMKIGLKLAETGYRFVSEERARVYLTNALEPWLKQLPLIGFEALAHEAAAVNEIKRHKRFTVIVGNPPYAGHSRNNEIRWIVDLVKDFTRHEPSLQGPGQGKWLQDDYVKFLRLSEYLLAPTEVAILAMITNHRYLTNRTFRGMRRMWRQYFPFTRILDLHGNNVVHEVSPLGHDDNVFDIEQGVAIGLFVKGGLTSNIGYQELWGARTTPDDRGKYDFLASHSSGTTEWEEFDPSPPDWLFSPRADVSEALRSEYESAVKMLELMPGALGPNGKPQSGLATMHDGFALSFSPAEVEQKVRTFLSTSNREEARQIFGGLCNPQQWDYSAAKRTLSSSAWVERVSPICFSPFDTRYTVYDKAVAVHLRRRLSDNLFGHQNLALVIGEAGQEISGEDWDAVSCVDTILQLNYFRRNGSPTLPLYLYDEDLLAAGNDGRRVNLSPPHLKRIADRLKLRVGTDGLPDGLVPEDIFHYAYAVFHSPGYRNRYAEFLKTDFPRLPLTGKLELFRALNRLGGELTALHLLKSPKLAETIAEFIGGRNSSVGRVGWSDDSVWLDARRTSAREGHRATVAGSIGFEGVPENVWKFHIGGYQVCHKWLKDRNGRTLSEGEVAHYQKILVAISETIRVMGEIDEAIDAHGGWPEAFASSPS